MLHDNARAGTLTTLAVMLAAAAVFFALLGKRDIATSHEARVAQTARQMAAVGWPWEKTARVRVVDPSSSTKGAIDVNPWLIPVINGHVRLEKPPLPYWCAAVWFKLFGVSEHWARITPALLGALATLLVADLARMVLSRRAALIAAIVWISSLFIVDEFRKTMADPYLAFFTTLAICSWIRSRAPEINSSRSYLFPVCVFYLALGMGVLSKGPLILVTVMPGIAAFEVCCARSPKARPALVAHLVGIAMFLVIAFAWPTLVLRQLPSARELWWGESIGKISEDVDRARPFWFYFLNTFQLALPWTPMWIAGIVLATLRFRKRGNKPGFATSVASRGASSERVSELATKVAKPGGRARRRAFPLVWYVLYLILFSCFGVKKDAYLLPMMAAQTLLITDALVLLIAWTRRDRAFRGMPGVLAHAQAAIGIGFAVAIAVILFRTDLIGASLACVAGLLSISTIYTVLRALPAWRWLAAQSLAYVLLIVAVVGFLNANRDNVRSPRGFAAAIGRHIGTTGTPLWLPSVPEDASFYLPLNVPFADSTSGAARVVVVIDDNHRDIERGRVAPDAEFFKTYVGDAPIDSIQRVPVDPADSGNGRWKAFELTFNWDRM